MSNKYSVFIRPITFGLIILMAAQTMPAAASWTRPFAAIIRPSFWAATAGKLVNQLRLIPTSTWIIAGLSATALLEGWYLRKGVRERRQLIHRHAAQQMQIDQLNRDLQRAAQDHQNAMAEVAQQLAAIRLHSQAARNAVLNSLEEEQQPTQQNQHVAPEQPHVVAAPTPIVAPAVPVHPQPASAPIVIPQAQPQTVQPAQEAPNRHFDASDIYGVFRM